MAFFRFVGLLALSLWMGGLATLGALTAPVLFEVLAGSDAAGGRELAGALFGAIFERFHHVSWAAGTVLLLSLAGRAALGPRPRHFGVRMWIVTAMLAASVTTALYVTPRIESLRAGASGPVASLPQEDPLRQEFGRWHAVSTGLMAFTLVAGIGLMWMEATDRH